MRAFALGLVFSAVAVPCLAQTVLKSEPLILAPYEVAFVQDASCPAGKVLKVTGAIRGLHRRKACVTWLRAGVAGDGDAVETIGLVGRTVQFRARRLPWRRLAGYRRHPQ